MRSITVRRAAALNGRNPTPERKNVKALKRLRVLPDFRARQRFYSRNRIAGWDWLFMISPGRLSDLAKLRVV